MSMFIFVPVRLMIAAIVTGSASSDAFVVDFVPLVFALIVIGIVIFAVK